MRSKIIAAVVVVAIIFIIAIAGNLWETVDAEDILVVQAPLSGTLTWHTTPGMKWQGLGKVTHYAKRSIYEFTKRVRFNDGAHADLFGSIQYEMPLDEKNLTEIHTKFGSPEAVQKQLIQTVVDKSTYMTGPLMSSKESYAEKRNNLIWFVEDQVTNGVYRTRQREERIKDPLTEQERIVTVVEVVMGKSGPERQEEAILSHFGVKPFNFSITELKYEEQVEKQIAVQQQAVMDVQTAMAESKKAEQRALTTVQEGKATAEKTRWEQEAIRAKEVTRAEQEKQVAELEAQKLLEVATLKARESEQYKRSQILRAEGDSAYKKQIMEADGALAQKLEAWVKVNGLYADAIAKYQGNWVPSVSMGQNSQQQNGAQALVDLLTSKTALDLSLNPRIGGTTTKP